MVKAKEKQIAYCGLICTDCAAYLATQADDDTQRKVVAEKWTKEYNHDFKPEDINCDGCLTVSGRVASYCPVCPIRICGKGKGVVNCGWCLEYPCNHLNEFFKMVPVCKRTLDAIHQSMNKV